MLATAGEPPDGPGWAYEFKWDGVRAIVSVDQGRVGIVSRNDRDVTPSYPDLAGVGEPLARHQVVLDGEIVATDAQGRPSFSQLQRRMHVVSPSAALLAQVPVRLYVFDLLYLDGAKLLSTPYGERRARLDAFNLDNASVITPPAFGAGSALSEVEAASAELGLEGVVAKRVDAPYQAGVRSRYWIKKPFNTTVEVLIGGWTPGEGRRAGTIGALLLGMYDDAGQLVYVGQVGTGFTQRMLTDLQRMLAQRRTDAPPFADPVPRAHARDANWVRPELVGEVVYRTLTPDGRLRHPSWRGLRPDRDPAEVRQTTVQP
jgi:bifunctional non-homologous end joining protein LigD